MGSFLKDPSQERRFLEPAIRFLSRGANQPMPANIVGVDFGSDSPTIMMTDEKGKVIGLDNEKLEMEDKEAKEAVEGDDSAPAEDKNTTDSESIPEGDSAGSAGPSDSPDPSDTTHQ